ncbi:hypothetical protein Tco_0007407 [Tanacetum coccineum]
MEAQYGKFLDMIRTIRISVPLVDVLAGMPNYGKFLKELVNNKHKIEQISSAFLSDESSAILQNKVPPKLGDPRSFLIPYHFNKAFSYNSLADLGASINLMSYSLYPKLSLKTLKPTKMSASYFRLIIALPILRGSHFSGDMGYMLFLTPSSVIQGESDERPLFVFLDIQNHKVYGAYSPVKFHVSRVEHDVHIGPLIDEGVHMLKAPYAARFYNVAECLIVLSLLSSSPLAKEIEFTFLVTGNLASSLINTFSRVMLVVIIAEFCRVLPVSEELSRMGSKILPCGDGSCWKTFKLIASLIAKGKL